MRGVASMKKEGHGRRDSRGLGTVTRTTSRRGLLSGLAVEDFNGLMDVELVSRHEERDAFYVIEDGELDVVVNDSVVLTLRRVRRL